MDSKAEMEGDRGKNWWTGRQQQVPKKILEEKHSDLWDCNNLTFIGITEVEEKQEQVWKSTKRNNG